MIKIYLFGKLICSFEKYAKDYFAWLDKLGNNKDSFVPFSQNKYHRKENDVKIFAFYLPQFHSIPENDEAYGKGFTEWTNVASCRPYFVGHYQPKIPYDVGFYNLLQPGVMERQVEIAKTYGIYGFCFYYYWFSGKRVLEKPLEYFLKSDIDFHFHFCWANENWSKLWDGGNREVILEQKLCDDDADKFFQDILPYIKDKRYEKIDNRPLLMIYRPSLFQKNKFIQFVDRINMLAKKEGFDGFYLMASNARGFSEPKSFGLEGIIEFPPYGLERWCPIIPVKAFLKSRFCVFDIQPFLKRKKHLEKKKYTVFKSCFPSWDNLPRKASSGGSCFKIDPSDFEEWLSDIIHYTQKHNKANEQYIYINAWNEWAEGAILEPTTRYGYKYLDIVKKVLERNRDVEICDGERKIK